MAKRQTLSARYLFGCLLFAFLASGCSWNSNNTNGPRVTTAADSDGCPSHRDRSRAKITGTVVGISDGDTATVRDESSTRHTIRLFAIDAPENGQDFAQVSRKNLSSLISNNVVCIVIIEKDQYGREVGIVYSAGEDINLAQVAAGMAWHYKEYQHQQSGNDRWMYDKAEGQARSEKRGLWKQADAVPPWEFRKANPRRNR